MVILFTTDLHKSITIKTRHVSQLARRLKLVTSVYLVTSYSTDISLLVPSRHTVLHDRYLSVLLTLLRPPSPRASSSNHEWCPGWFNVLSPPGCLFTARKYKYIFFISFHYNSPHLEGNVEHKINGRPLSYGGAAAGVSEVHDS